jgi:hypothetical protein
MWRNTESYLEGTKFRLFPQPPFLEEYEVPETVYTSSPAGTVGLGPSDERMYVVDPINKWPAYGIHTSPQGTPYMYLPPWNGPISPPAKPDANGHFDHLEPGTSAFRAAHLFGSVHFTLDVWEQYFGGRIEWHSAPDYPQLELVLLPEFDNAQIGYGFLEVGSNPNDDGTSHPFSLNFDVIAHEVGHALIYSVVGLPDPGTEQGEYFGFHESAADLVAMIAVLHFDSVVDNLMENTHGNLYVLNKLNRFAELTDNEQIRLAANASTLSEFSDGWTSEHDLSQPLTGAMFDILVDIFHENLLDSGLISGEMEDLADQIEGLPEYQEQIQALYDEAYWQHPEGFKQALLDARDIMGTYLAATWRGLNPEYFNFVDVAENLINVDKHYSGGRYRSIIQNNLHRREIGSVTVGPRLAAPNEKSHTSSTRTFVPEESSGYLALS